MKRVSLRVFALILTISMLVFMAGCSAVEGAVEDAIRDAVSDAASDILNDMDVAPDENTQGDADTDTDADTDADTDTDADANMLKFNDEMINFVDLDNSYIKAMFDGNEFFNTVYWGGTPAAVYRLGDSERYITFLLNTNGDYEGMNDDYFSADDADANKNLWSDDYTIDAIVLYPDAVSMLFDGDMDVEFDSFIVTYSDLQAAYPDIPALEFTEPDEVLTEAYPYVIYDYNGKSLHLQFMEVSGEYVLDIVMVTQLGSNMRTYYLFI